MFSDGDFFLGYRFFNRTIFLLHSGKFLQSLRWRHLKKMFQEKKFLFFKGLKYSDFFFHRGHLERTVLFCPLRNVIGNFSGGRSRRK